MHPGFWERKRRMKNKYDIIYLTNTPSFYKVNLCNEVARHCTLLLVLYGYGQEAVNMQLKDNKQFSFDYVFLSEGDSAKRNKIKTFFRLFALLRRVKYEKLLYAGWFIPEYNIVSFFTPKSRNVVLCESSVRDVSLTGIKGWIKKRIISRMSTALPSGELHVELFKVIGFKGKIIKTGGVGIFNKSKGLNFSTKHNPPYKYLYVGRLVPVKNLEFIVRCFNELGRPLTIVGSGELENRLKQIAANNITFKDFIPNEDLPQVYSSHDVFILPSVYEPWGLVVDEAIYWGLPVIVSDVVGCSVDMVVNPGTGVIFKSNDVVSFVSAVNEIEHNYDKYKQAVDAYDFDKRDRLQVAAYLKLLE